MKLALPSGSNKSYCSVDAYISMPLVTFFSLSDNAFEALLAFLRAVFDSLETIFPKVERFAISLPKPLHLLCKQLGLDQDKFKNYFVCLKTMKKRSSLITNKTVHFSMRQTNKMSRLIEDSTQNWIERPSKNKGRSHCMKIPCSERHKRATKP